MLCYRKFKPQVCVFLLPKATYGSVEMKSVLVLFSLLLSFSSFAKSSASNVNVETLALQKLYLQTIDCRASKKLSNLIESATKSADDLTAKGINASVMEEIMMNNPSCFIQALNHLPKKVCRQIEENYINETFFYPRDEIKRALSNAKNYSNSCVAG